MLPTLRELGIGLTAYGVLGRGLLSGHWAPGRRRPRRVRGPAHASPAGTWSTTWPWWRRCAGSPTRRACTVAQLAIAWVAAQGRDIVPLVGARTRERLAEALPAVELNLTADDLAEIEKAVPAGAARGDRYPPAFMSGLGVGN